VIAIDGPAGSGKSTVAKAVAERLELERLDTGAMYRAVTMLVLRSAAGLDDDTGWASLAAAMDLDVGERVVLNGEDVTEAIRTPEVDRAVSAVSANPGVRQELVRRQRLWAARHGGGVVEGRDIGSVVFPQAALKVYLTADPVERARRRADQTGASDVGSTEAALVARDELDSSRQTSPLHVPAGAIVVDSTGKPVDQVVEEVLSQL
jgi:cytidylate kinase